MSTAKQCQPSAGYSPQPFESEAVRRVRDGTLTLDEFLEQKLEEALAHVRGKVSAGKLDSLRFALREKLRSDPLLVEMVRRTTGLVPEPLGDTRGS